MKKEFANLKESFEKYFSFLNQKMIEEQLVKRGISDKRLLAAFSKLRRHDFLPKAVHSRAYDDCAIEVFPNQTISQPYVTAFMIEKLNLNGNERILEIGTGTGYQTALLCLLGREVFSIDIKENLKESALKNLKKLGVNNFSLITADGKKGLPQNSPFDAIIVSCAFSQMPQQLIDQMSENSSLVAPIGLENQLLTLVKKKGDKIEIEKSLAVRFVPIV